MLLNNYSSYGAQHYHGCSHSSCDNIVLVALASGPVVKGYGYIRGVKECNKDVQRLISETNALGRLLEPLEKEIKKSESTGEEGGTIRLTLKRSKTVGFAVRNALTLPHYVYESTQTLKQRRQDSATF